MRRFYAKPEDIREDTVYFDGEQSAHISRVLRMQAGESILVSDGTGLDREAELTQVGKQALARVKRSFPNPNEASCELVLFMSMIKNEKMELALQKVTEIGIKKIVPVQTEHCIIRLDDAAKKRERWQKIVLEACKQCGRSFVPQVAVPCTFASALQQMQEYEIQLVAYEEERTRGLTQVLDGQKRIAYFIGPEGGITPGEQSALVQNGAVSVSLGRRILRAETAAIVCGAVILACLGEMDHEVCVPVAGV